MNRLNSAPTSQDSAPATSVTSVTSAYRKPLDNNSQNNDHSVSRRAEMFESDHSTLGDVKTNNDQPSSRVTESTAAKPHNRYTVSQNARVQPNAGATTRDRGREMMERRKESENQVSEEYVRVCL